MNNTTESAAPAERIIKPLRLVRKGQIFQTEHNGLVHHWKKIRMYGQTVIAHHAFQPGDYVFRTSDVVELSQDQKRF